MEIKTEIFTYEQFKALIGRTQAKQALKTMENAGINEGFGFVYCDRLFRWVEDYYSSMGEIVDFDQVKNILAYETEFLYTAVGLSRNGYTLKEVMERKDFDELYDTYDYMYDNHGFDDVVLRVLDEIQVKGKEELFMQILKSDFWDASDDFEDIAGAIVDNDGYFYSAFDAHDLYRILEDEKFYKLKDALEDVYVIRWAENAGKSNEFMHYLQDKVLNLGMDFDDMEDYLNDHEEEILEALDINVDEL